MIDTWLAIIILFEVLITLAIIYGFMHEGEIILFEDMIIQKIKTRLSRYKLRRSK